MKSKFLALTSATLPAFLAVACAAETDVVAPPGQQPPATGEFAFAAGTVQADAALAGEIQVEPEQLIIPKSYEKFVNDNLQAGTVFFGDRAPSGAANNPLGFLRHVENVSVEADRIVIGTTQATLTELFDSADLAMDGEPDYAGVLAFPDDFGDIEPPVELDTDSPSEDPIDDGSGEVEPLQAGSWSTALSFSTRYGFDSGKLAASGIGNVRWQGALTRRFQVRPRTTISYRSRGRLRVPNLDINLALPWQQQDTACSVIEGTLNRLGTNRFLQSNSTTMFKRSFPVPAMGPVPTTIRFEVKVGCAPFISGKEQMTTTTTTGGNVTVAFGTDQGGNFYNRASQTRTAPRTTRTLISQGSGGVKCELKVRAGFYFFDWLGAFAQYAPALEVGVTGQGKYQTGRRPEGSTCFDMKFSQSVDVGLSADVGVSLERSANIWKRENKIASYCFSDTCANAADGWYCDKTNPQSARRCQGRQTAGGDSCPSGQYCQVANASTGAAQTNASGIVCGATRPATTSPIQSLSCQ